MRIELEVPFLPTTIHSNKQSCIPVLRTFHILGCREGTAYIMRINQRPTWQFFRGITLRIQNLTDLKDSNFTPCHPCCKGKNHFSQPQFMCNMGKQLHSGGHIVPMVEDQANKFKGCRTQEVLGNHLLSYAPVRGKQQQHFQYCIRLSSKHFTEMITQQTQYA